ncbi:TPA: phage tail protein [Yersinia enterocolitica]|uniref:phage tail protein n=1 Tax=Yersinia enterocolitica TaxID=630 RepID=UPI0018A2679B|nr:phage tail protein [Yersinia enterocolitica]HDM8292201.1 phage tail protein [Yersinia enterocolitica]HDM8296215.1 phage tail protein [Yersinia enterocolitica]HDM8321547.1 phage tail protein [Yersinia enterocolitica]HDM8333678.1 phage tail protein [Yersinia enterocolitica]
MAEQIISETEGGWWIREIGLLNKSGELIAIANCPESYKPQMQEGSGRTQLIRMILMVSSTAVVILKTDPAVVLATRQYADQLISNHIRTRNISSPATIYLILAIPKRRGLTCNSALLRREMWVMSTMNSWRSGPLAGVTTALLPRRGSMRSQ